MSSVATRVGNVPEVPGFPNQEGAQYQKGLLSILGPPRYNGRPTKDYNNLRTLYPDDVFETNYLGTTIIFLVERVGSYLPNRVMPFMRIAKNKSSNAIFERWEVNGTIPTPRPKKGSVRNIVLSKRTYVAKLRNYGSGFEIRDRLFQTANGVAQIKASIAGVVKVIHTLIDLNVLHHLVQGFNQSAREHRTPIRANSPEEAVDQLWSNIAILFREMGMGSLWKNAIENLKGVRPNIIICPLKGFIFAERKDPHAIEYYRSGSRALTNTKPHTYEGRSYAGIPVYFIRSLMYSSQHIPTLLSTPFVREREIGDWWGNAIFPKHLSCGPNTYTTDMLSRDIMDWDTMRCERVTITALMALAYCSRFSGDELSSFHRDLAKRVDNIARDTGMRFKDEPWKFDMFVVHDGNAPSTNKSSSKYMVANKWGHLHPFNLTESVVLFHGTTFGNHARRKLHGVVPIIRKGAALRRRLEKYSDINDPTFKMIIEACADALVTVAITSKGIVFSKEIRDMKYGCIPIPKWTALDVAGKYGMYLSNAITPRDMVLDVGNVINPTIVQKVVNAPGGKTYTTGITLDALDILVRANVVKGMTSNQLFLFAIRAVEKRESNKEKEVRETVLEDVAESELRFNTEGLGEPGSRTDKVLVEEARRFAFTAAREFGPYLFESPIEPIGHSSMGGIAQYADLLKTPNISTGAKAEKAVIDDYLNATRELKKTAKSVYISKKSVNPFLDAKRVPSPLKCDDSEINGDTVFSIAHYHPQLPCMIRTADVRFANLMDIATVGVAGTEVVENELIDLKKESKAFAKLLFDGSKDHWKGIQAIAAASKSFGNLLRTFGTDPKSTSAWTEFKNKWKKNFHYRGLGKARNSMKKFFSRYILDSKQKSGLKVYKYDKRQLHIEDEEDVYVSETAPDTARKLAQYVLDKVIADEAEHMSEEEEEEDEGEGGGNSPVSRDDVNALVEEFGSEVERQTKGRSEKYRSSREYRQLRPRFSNTGLVLSPSVFKPMYKRAKNLEGTPKSILEELKKEFRNISLLPMDPLNEGMPLGVSFLIDGKMADRENAYKLLKYAIEGEGEERHLHHCHLSDKPYPEYEGGASKKRQPASSLTQVSFYNTQPMFYISSHMNQRYIDIMSEDMDPIDRIGSLLLVVQDISKCSLIGMLKKDIFLPVEFYCARPFQRFTFGSVMVGKGGPQLGRTLVAAERVQVERTPSNSTYVRYDADFGWVIIDDTQYYISADAIPIKYLRGAGKKFFTPEHPQFPPDGNVEEPPSIFSEMCPAGSIYGLNQYYEKVKSPHNFTGVWDPKVFKGVVNLETYGGKWDKPCRPSAMFSEYVYNFTTEIRSPSSYRKTTWAKEFASHNMFVAEAHQFICPLPGTSAEIIKKGTGPLGDENGPGMKVAYREEARKVKTFGYDKRSNVY